MPITDIVDAVSSNAPVWRTLCDIEPLRRDGTVEYVTGNASVCFTVRHEGRVKILKCYTRRKPYLREIYGERFLPRELCVIALTGDKVWIDCLLYDRIEGSPLDRVMSSTDRATEFRLLAEAFDRTAHKLLGGEVAHGDLKPDNIIVGEGYQMTLVDFDAAFLPSMKGRCASEVGTAAYQHPDRTIDFFDRHIDDYSIAMLSTKLHIAALDDKAAQTIQQHHETIFRPDQLIAGTDSEFNAYVETFARRGDAIRYRIASMLGSPQPRLFTLHRTLSFAIPHATPPTIEGASLEQEEGLWGCRGNDGWIIPPLYDDGFEPSNGHIILYLNGYAHIFELSARRIVASFDKGVSIKPSTEGSLTINYPDSRCEVIELESLLQNSAK